MMTKLRTVMVVGVLCALSACRDPEQEAALLLALDVAQGDDASDSTGDAADSADDAPDSAGDTLDSAGDALDSAGDVVDSAGDAADSSGDAVDSADDADAVNPCGGKVCGQKTCQVGTCDPSTGECVWTTAVDKTGCDDGEPCTAADECTGGVCKGTKATECVDGNDCTDDSCQLGKGCVHPNNKTLCDDGNACTEGDTCSAGSCTAGTTAPVCTDGTLCTDDGCDPASGCTHTFNTAPCQDGDPCTINDACANGLCAAGTPDPCDDGVACTADACVAVLNCTHTPNAAACNDSNPCTTDSCEANGCKHANDQTGFGCDDGNPCTVADACSPSGGCAGGGLKNCDDANPCTNDGCDALTGNCTHGAGQDGVACDADGSLCTDNDSCSGGTCQAGPALNCDDSNACTTDTCVPATGCSHSNLAEHAPCGSQSYCTLNALCELAVCSDGVKQAWLGEECDDANQKNGDGCTALCKIEPSCGNGVCDKLDTVYNCPADCGVLRNMEGPDCTLPGQVDTCPAGYTCMERGGGAKLCIADFPTWPATGDAHPASDFQVGTDTVTDARTGLMWAKTDFEPTTWSASSSCNMSLLGGYADWRMPTRTELLSLVDLTSASPASKAPFVWPTDGNFRYWTGQQGGSAALGLIVNFEYGNNGAYAVGDSARIRCVRRTSPGGQGVAPTRFAAQDAGATVLDRLTGLTWQQAANASQPLDAASAACTANAPGLPGSGWRLPTRRELESLVLITAVTPALDGAFSLGTTDQTWSSSPAIIPANSWALFFNYGNAFYQFTTATLSSRCVRDCEGDCSALCGDGVCGGTETVASCAADCGFLTNHLTGNCNNPGAQDVCGQGFVCIQRQTDNICVADTEIWGALPLAHPIGDFKVLDPTTIQDKVTGLTWTKSTSAPMAAPGAHAYCATSTFGGQLDWRVPTVAELTTLLDLTGSNGTATKAPMQFPYGKYVWAATPWAGGSSNQWQVDFSTGRVTGTAASDSDTVLCVRGGTTTWSAGAGKRFDVEAGGTTVLDRVTGLHWERGPVTILSKTDAASHCAAPGLPGTGWRVPNINELRTLVQRDFAIALDSVFDATQQGAFWSTTEFAGQPWFAYADTGSIAYDTVGSASVRCVR